MRKANFLIDGGLYWLVLTFHVFTLRILGHVPRLTDAPNGRISPRRAAGQHCSVAVGQHGSPISMAGRQHSSSAGSGPALQLEIRPMAVSLWRQWGNMADQRRGNMATRQDGSIAAQ